MNFDTLRQTTKLNPRHSIRHDSGNSVPAGSEDTTSVPMEEADLRGVCVCVCVCVCVYVCCMGVCVWMGVCVYVCV